MGSYSFSFLSQLGDIYSIDLDANILSPGKSYYFIVIVYWDSSINNLSISCLLKKWEKNYLSLKCIEVQTRLNQTNIGNESKHRNDWHKIICESVLWTLWIFASMVLKICKSWFRIFKYHLGPEVQSHRIWSSLCSSLANNGIFCKPWRLDRRHTCEQRPFSDYCPKGNK